MADLSWFPYDVDDWTKRVRELALSYADEGALMRLYRGAWVDPDPCTIADTPDEFARLLGAHWEKVLPILRVHFTPHPEKHGRLRSDWLLDVYQKALAKHESYSKRGKLGGRPPKTGADAESSAFKNESSAFGNGGKTESSAISSAKAELSAKTAATPRRRTGGGKQKAQLMKTESSAKAQLSQSTTEVLSCALTEHTAKNPTTDGAHAPDGGAALAVVNNGNGNGEPPREATPPRISTDAEHRAREVAARNDVRPGGAPVVRQARMSALGNVLAEDGSIMPPATAPPGSAAALAVGRSRAKPTADAGADRVRRTTQTARRNRLGRDYTAMLDKLVVRWGHQHPDAAATLERITRERCGFAVAHTLTPREADWFRTSIRAAFFALPREHPLPSAAEWIAEQEALEDAGPPADLFVGTPAASSDKRVRVPT